ncbi:MAG: STAS domain-containing protein [Hymenobacteraceae bacterium]|nr:STAS domain-containing protein [Hymenobacteraceae bacterium]
MQLYWKRDGGILLLQLTGVLATADTALLDSTIKAQTASGIQEVWLDCDALESVSTGALEYLTLCQHCLQEEGIHLLLVHLSHDIISLFKQVQLDATLPVMSTLEMAYASYRSKLQRQQHLYDRTR